MGISGDASNRSPIGVFSSPAVGAGTTNMIIRNDSITNSGYLGIEWAGSNFLIENNYINNYCLIKDDGGGIYTFNSIGASPSTFTNRMVRYNVILNGPGCYFGTNGTLGKARILYNDDNTNNVTYYKNVGANASNAGAYNNTTKGIVFDNNIFYNCLQGFSFNRYPSDDTLKSITLNHNYFLPLGISNVSDNDINNPYTRTIDQAISRAFTMDSSVYYTRSGTALLDSFFQARTYNGTTITSANKNINYFKAMGMETHSQVIDSASVLFDYNPNYAPKVISLGAYVYSFEGLNYSGNYVIPSKKAVLLFKGALITLPSGTIYLNGLKFIH